MRKATVRYYFDGETLGGVRVDVEQHRGVRGGVPPDHRFAHPAETHEQGDTLGWVPVHALTASHSGTGDPPSAWRSHTV